MIETMNRKPTIEEAAEVRDHSEGTVARAIENQTSKLPSDVWFWGALGSMGVSLYLQMQNRKEASVFVGQWAAPLLLIGVYNKTGQDRRVRSVEPV